ncbi:putative thymidylate synthase [Pectobacterium phage PP101]|uniref:Putative thymidylate synthase n=1 Tax=Pectobacterium phage PP101 TaxID=1916414 RepID=A0A1J0MF56_9CAUD|nr:thymidylate synthase [Pectobacterium phage PP101]APD19742.1 putative thymidylate synthase [Pectobacterium phage PP101]
MGNDLTTVNAARVSYGAWSTNFGDRDAALVEFLAEHKHVTPFRHAQITLRCKGPIFLVRQLGKHQTGFSWNELSRRYKDGDAIEVECYVPEIVLGRPNNLMKETAQPLPPDFAADMQYRIDCINKTAIAEYKALLEIGVAPEQARMVLPQSMLTEWIWTGSLFGWASLYRQRSKLNAQLEARIFAEKLDAIMSELFPICWKALIK